MYQEYQSEMIAPQSNDNIRDIRPEIAARKLSALQLANLKAYFDTTPDSDPILHRAVKREIKRRVDRNEMYQDIINGE